jgi:uncharacterized membrane protein HdeD (DUF308 family)
MDKFFDLRFVIGLFFLITGIMLFLYSLTNVHEAHEAVNRWSSVFFIVFSVIMILLAFSKKPKDKL